MPAPNGLIPQAPIHTTSLRIMGRSNKNKDAEENPQPNLQSKSACITDEHLSPNGGSPNTQLEVPVGVVEQRVSNLAQGSLCLVLLTGPFLHVLNLIPRGTHYILCPVSNSQTKCMQASWQGCCEFSLHIALIYFECAPFAAGSWVQMLFKGMESR